MKNSFNFFPELNLSLEVETILYNREQEVYDIDLTKPRVGITLEKAMNLSAYLQTFNPLLDIERVTIWITFRFLNNENQLFFRVSSFLPYSPVFSNILREVNAQSSIKWPSIIIDTIKPSIYILGIQRTEEELLKFPVIFLQTPGCIRVNPNLITKISILINKD